MASRRRFSRPVLAASITVFHLAVLLAAGSAVAATFWTDWTSFVAGAPGSATGTLSGIAVSYDGEVRSDSVTDGAVTVWNPDSTYVGGSVTSSPDTVGDVIFMTGGVGHTHTLTFSAPVTNPVFAIWSLGQEMESCTVGCSDITASYIFSATPALQVGGPSSLHPTGQSITVAGNTVSGMEGNGVVQFQGTFNSLSWTNGTPETFYGFTVGVVPEPSTALLFALGLAGLGVRRRTGG